MKIAHSIEVTVFCKPGEDKVSIEAALRDLVPLGLEKDEEYPLLIQDAELSDGSIMQILKVILAKTSDLNAYLQWLHQKLTMEQKTLLHSQLDSRLDDDCNFFMRFHKDKWMEEKRLWLVDHGNCFHVKITVAAYPKNKKSATHVITTWLEA